MVSQNQFFLGKILQIKPFIEKSGKMLNNQKNLENQVKW